MRLPKPRPLSPTVPVAALATVTLQLVFALQVATSFAPAGSELALPRAACVHRVAPGVASLIVLRRVTASSGEVLAWRFSSQNGEVHDLSPGDLYFEASRIVDIDPERTFLLRVDAGVRFAVVDEILETLRKAGVHNIVLGSRPDETEGA